MFKKLSSAMGKSSSFHSERKPPAPPPPHQSSPPGGSSDSDNFDSASSSADSLEGSVELTIVLPNGKTVFMSVEKRMPMMDLLIHVATANKISPGSHVISVFNDNSKDAVTYTPSTPIGTLNTSVIYVVPKKNSDHFAKKPGKMSSTQPFEHTFRLQVHLPRNQLLVLRVSQQIRLSDLHDMICTQKGLDATRYALQHPVSSDIPLDYSCSLADYNLTEIHFVSKRSTIVPNYNSSNELLDIGRDSTDEKKRKSVFGFVFRRSKSSLGDSSSDDRSSRGVSPTRSDGSGHQSLSPPLSSPPGTMGKHVVKKRPAPPPPAPLQKQRAEKPPPPPPFRPKSATLSNSDLEHTRTKSDSSVSLDRASLEDSPERYDLPAVSKKVSTSKMGAASSLSNLSTTSSTTSGVKKRRAPPPPMKLPNATSIVAVDCHQPPLDNGKVSPSAAISVGEDVVRFVQSSTTSQEPVNEIHKPTVKNTKSQEFTVSDNSRAADLNERSGSANRHTDGVPIEEIGDDVKRQEVDNVDNRPISKTKTESESLEHVDVPEQKQEPDPLTIISAVEEPEEEHIEGIRQSVSNFVETSSATVLNTTASSDIKFLGEKQQLSSDSLKNQEQFEQDQAISMVHEVFQDIDQDYSDEDDDVSDSKVCVKSENSDNRKYEQNPLNKSEQHEELKHFDDRIHMRSLPNNSDSDMEGSSTETNVIMETESPILHMPMFGANTDETVHTSSFESSNEANDAPMLPALVVEPTLPLPSLPLSSVASTSASSVDRDDCAEHLESSLKVPVHHRPASSSSAVTSHNSNENGFLPDQYCHPVTDVASPPVANKSTLNHELPPTSTMVSSVLRKSSVDIPAVSNENTAATNFIANGKPSSHQAVDVNVRDFTLKDSVSQREFHGHAGELHISLPDHHERAIQTSPVPEVQHFGSKGDVSAQLDGLNNDARNSRQNKKWDDANGAVHFPSSDNQNTAIPKSALHRKPSEVSASFPDDRRHNYQWNDVLISDSLQSAGADDEWVSSCSEGETEEISARRSLTKIHFHTRPNRNCAPASKKENVHIPEIESISESSRYKQNTRAQVLNSVSSAKHSGDHDDCNSMICKVSPVIVGQQTKQSAVLNSLTEEVEASPIKSKANTLPHTVTKIMDDNANENSLAGKASTLPFNAERGNYTNESRPPLVPKFKRPLMNFSISTYKSRTEIEPSYETRLVKSESFSVQPMSQQAREASGRPVVSRGTSFQGKGEDGKRQFVDVGTNNEYAHDGRRKSSTLPVSQQHSSLMSSDKFEAKTSIERASSLTYLADSDESQVFRTQSVQSLQPVLGKSDSQIILPTDREEVLVLQQEYLKLQKQLLHWQQQLLSNQNLLQKQHILPENAFQLSSEMLLLKRAEEPDGSLLTETTATYKEPQFIEPQTTQTTIKECIPEKNGGFYASEAKRTPSAVGTYMKLHMCQPYKAKTDVHGRIEAPKLNMDVSVKLQPSTTTGDVGTKLEPTKSSYQGTFVGGMESGSVVPGSQSKVSNRQNDKYPMIPVQSKSTVDMLNTDSSQPRDVKSESRRMFNIHNAKPVPRPQNELDEENDTQVNLPSVKDRVSMLFGKSSSNIKQSQPATKPVISGMVGKKSASVYGSAAKIDSKASIFTNGEAAGDVYPPPDQSSTVYSSIPVMSNVGGKHTTSGESNTQREKDRQRVLSDAAIPVKNKFRRQRFEPSVLHDASINNISKSVHPSNGNYNPGSSSNIGREVQFSISSSASQQRKEWEAPPRNSNRQSVDLSPNLAIVQGCSRPSGEKKNITKVSINGGSATVNHSGSQEPSTKSIIDTRQQLVTGPPPPPIEFASGKNSVVKSSTKKMPVKMLHQDPRSMLLDQIKNFGGRENLRDSRHRE